MRKKIGWTLSVILLIFQSMSFAQTVTVSEEHIFNKESDYQSCLKRISKECQFQLDNTEFLTVAEITQMQIERTDACFNRISEFCEEKYQACLSLDFGYCLRTCNETRHVDLIYCEADHVAYCSKWQSCSDAMITIGQRCYQSCAQQYIPSQASINKITTDPLGVGTIGQNLNSLFDLQNSPLPDGSNS